jgi:hypothetical protein
MKWNQITKCAMVLAMLVSGLCPALRGQILPNTGQRITPLAPHDTEFVPLNPGLSDNPQYLAGQAATSVVSPDGKTISRIHRPPPDSICAPIAGNFSNSPEPIHKPTRFGLRRARRPAWEEDCNPPGVRFWYLPG